MISNVNVALNRYAALTTEDQETFVKRVLRVVTDSKAIAAVNEALLYGLVGDQADATVMRYMENWKAELWAFDHLSEADKVSSWHAIQAHGF